MPPHLPWIVVERQWPPPQRHSGLSEGGWGESDEGFLSLTPAEKLTNFTAALNRFFPFDQKPILG